VSGSGISWAICKSASRSRQITMPAPHHSCFLQARCPACHPTNGVKALKATGSHVVSIKVEQLVVCTLSNGEIAHDIECFLTSPNLPIFCTLHCHLELCSGCTQRPIFRILHPVKYFRLSAPNNLPIIGRLPIV